MLAMERVILAPGSDDEDEEDDLYKGYNQFHPALDTRNLSGDEVFRAQTNAGKSSYGTRLGASRGNNRSTTGAAFDRGTIKSRNRTTTSRGTRQGATGASGAPATARPITAVRGAGYTSHGSEVTGKAGVFDPLGLAGSGINGKATQFHLINENTPEVKVRQLELQINRLLEESVNAASRKDFGLALDLAKDCVAKERSFNRMKEQTGLSDSFAPNSDLTFAIIFNLAEQYSNNQMWAEAINTYQSILNNRAFTNTGRLRMNIGEIYFVQGNYPKAIKFFRMALDQVASTQVELRLKMMQNIGLSFVRLAQFADAIASFEYIMSERGDLDVQTAFHLIVCYYALGDADKMKYYFSKLLQVKVEDQFEERYGHHEVLTNGGNIFGSIASPDIKLNGGMEMRTLTPANERISSPVLLIRDELDHHNNLLIEAIRNDQLRLYEREMIHHAEWCILTAAKLIAPFIDDGRNMAAAAVGAPETIGTGYDWCLEHIRRQASVASIAIASVSGINFAHLASELELYKAVKHLRAREFDKAIVTLKSFEKKDKILPARSGTTPSGTQSVTPTLDHQRLISSSTTSRVAVTVSTNLSFLYLLQQDYEMARRYTDEAISINRYYLGALLNKGNVCYFTGDYQHALEFYREVINNNSTSLEAYFNIALAERKLGNFEKALEALFRIQSLNKLSKTQQQTTSEKADLAYSQKISSTLETTIMYQIGSIYEAMGNCDQATDFYQQILNFVPSDVSLLIKLADLAADGNDRKQSLSYLTEAYRYLPSHIPTIERLAAYYIEVKMYEKAIKYLKQLANTQPNQIKWQLMIAASHRRAGNYQQAFSSYQDIHNRFPDNIDCLKLLIRLCGELEAEESLGGKNGRTNYAHLIDRYSDTLKRLEKSRELREQQQQSRSTSRASVSGGQQNFRTGSSREGSAATSTSSGRSSSGYLTSATQRSKTPKSANDSPLLTDPFGGRSNNGSGSSSDRVAVAPSPIEGEQFKTPNISAIVDQVVEQLDSKALNERPTTSWRRRGELGSSKGETKAGETNGTNGTYFDDDLLLDANIDDILPD